MSKYMLIKQLRTRKQMVKGGVIKQRYFRLLHKEHAQVLKSLKYYKNAE
jgi:hypothetical protein